MSIWRRFCVWVSNQTWLLWSSLFHVYLIFWFDGYIKVSFYALISNQVSVLYAEDTYIYKL